jgi:hypothetical protein
MGKSWRIRASSGCAPYSQILRICSSSAMRNRWIVAQL